MSRGGKRPGAGRKRVTYMTGKDGEEHLYDRLLDKIDAIIESERHKPEGERRSWTQVAREVAQRNVAIVREHERLRMITFTSIVQALYRHRRDRVQHVARYEQMRDKMAVLRDLRMTTGNPSRGPRRR